MAKTPHKMYEGASKRHMGKRHERQEHLDKNSYPIGPTGIGGNREEMERLGSTMGMRANSTAESNKHVFQHQMGLLGEDSEHVHSNHRGGLSHGHDGGHHIDRVKRGWP